MPKGSRTRFCGGKQKNSWASVDEGTQQPLVWVRNFCWIPALRRCITTWSTSHFMSPRCVVHMWLHTSALQTTSFLILENFQTQLLLRTHGLAVRSKRLWSYQMKCSAVAQKTIQAFTCHAFWNPHWEVLDGVSTEGGPPPCPCPELTPLRLSDVSWWQTQKDALFFHGENSLWFCLYIDYFFTLIFF